MKKWTFIIIGVILFITHSQAQNTGHLGKRFLINFDGTFSPSYKYADFNGRNGYFNFNYRVSPSLEFVLTSKRSVGLMYTYSKTMFGLFEDNFNNSILNIPIKIHGYGFFYKKYFSLFSIAHAPYGNYFMVAFSRINYTYYNEWVANGAGNMYAIQTEFGYNYLLFNRLRLTWAFTLGLTTSGSGIGMDEDYFPERVTPQTVLEHAEKRLYRTYIFGTKIGIGFLAF